MGNLQDPNNDMVAQFTGTDVVQMQLMLDGKKLAFQKANPMAGGTATMTKDGSKYTFTGKAAEMGAPPDLSNPTAPTSSATHDFNLEVSCP